MQIRLAMREEGSFWNAYLAKSDSMEGAKLIGSILVEPARNNPEVKAAFQELMQRVLADAVEHLTGGKITEWDFGPAPEAERAGHS